MDGIIIAENVRSTKRADVSCCLGVEAELGGQVLSCLHYHLYHKLKVSTRAQEGERKSQFLPVIHLV